MPRVARRLLSVWLWLALVYIRANVVISCETIIAGTKEIGYNMSNQIWEFRSLPPDEFSYTIRA